MSGIYDGYAMIRPHKSRNVRIAFAKFNDDAIG
jgi:hypothetical protein